jgi:L-lactate dehydrogenase complex protein LldG
VNSREKILAAVKKNQPALEALPSLQAIDAIRFNNPQEQFGTVLASIGGLLLPAQSLQQVADYVSSNFKEGSRYISTVKGLPGIPVLNVEEDAHLLENAEVAVMEADFGVAENSAVWVTTGSFTIRALPFICQHLVVILNPTNIVHNMHEAYERIGDSPYDFGVFIAGPSKTADIEQSLVLGAHGPKSMTVFYLA